MNTIRTNLTLLTIVILAIACNPIEDNDLRDKYYTSPGTPISVDELSSALEVSQPFPNVEDNIKGDQYIAVKNNRPDIGGSWHIKMENSEKTSSSDKDTLTCIENGIAEIYYLGISAGQIVKSKPIQLTVTNVFDEYETLLNGATNKAETMAKKTWEFKPIYDDIVCYMGAHGAWKHASNLEVAGIAWWAQRKITEIGNQTMVFEYDKHRLTTYDKDGNKIAEGNYIFNHEDLGEDIKGELITTIPVIGSQYDEATGGQVTGTDKKNIFWIISLNDNSMIIYHPSKYIGSVDWADSGWWAFYRVKE